MSAFDAIAQAMVTQGRRELAAKAAENAARPIGEKRLDIGFYSDAERDKPISDGEMTDRDGRRVSWTGARWAVWRVRWTGSEWRHYRRLSGPLNGCGAALTRLVEECKRLGLERVP